MDEWQPIETAPRDGRKVLLWHGAASVAATGEWSQELDGWRVLGGWQGDQWRHWMPLPEPPAA